MALILSILHFSPVNGEETTVILQMVIAREQISTSPVSWIFGTLKSSLDTGSKVLTEITSVNPNVKLLFGKDIREKLKPVYVFFLPFYSLEVDFTSS